MCYNHSSWGVRMKVIIGEEVRVQNKDLRLLPKTGGKYQIPVAVIHEINNSSESDPEDFTTFYGENMIGFFDSVEYIMDSSKVDQMTWVQSVNLGGSIIMKLNQTQREFDSLGQDASEETRHALSDELDILRYELECAKQIMDDKKGELVFVSKPRRKALIPSFLRVIRRK